MDKMLTEVSIMRKGKVWERNNISLLLFLFLSFFPPTNDICTHQVII